MGGQSKIPMKDLRNRVNALRRKMALPLAVVRLRPVAEEFCLQWTAALACGQPAPQSHPLIGRVVGQGFRLPTFLALHNYLDRCRSRNTLPDCDELLRSLLPWAAARGLLGAPKGARLQE